MSKSKYSSEMKLQIVQDYLSGKRSLLTVARELGHKCPNNSVPGCLKRWVQQYLEQGEAAFVSTKGNHIYTKEFKTFVVEEYLAGKGSLLELTAKYKISTETILMKWIKMYNANRTFKDYAPKREVYMAEARRKTTFEERKEIVRYCIEHDRDYSGTASLYEVSYSQIYSWVKKYDIKGEDGLTDKRGKHKTDEEVDELERLRRENARLKKQLEEKDMLTELLKKVQEFERM